MLDVNLLRPMDNEGNWDAKFDEEFKQIYWWSSDWTRPGEWQEAEPTASWDIHTAPTEEPPDAASSSGTRTIQLDEDFPPEVEAIYMLARGQERREERERDRAARKRDRTMQESSHHAGVLEPRAHRRRHQVGQEAQDQQDEQFHEHTVQAGFTECPVSAGDLLEVEQVSHDAEHGTRIVLAPDGTGVDIQVRVQYPAQGRPR